MRSGTFWCSRNCRSHFTLQTGYVGSAGHHLFTRYQINLIDPATGKRPLSQFSQFGLKTNDGNNTFNALQVSLDRRFTHGFLWQTQYMWSHGIADSSIGAGESISFQNQACRRCDRSDTTIDVRHTTTSNAIYQLPFGAGRRFLNDHSVASAVLGGWELSGIATASSGRPVNITIRRKRQPAAGWEHGVAASGSGSRSLDLCGESDHRQLVQSGCVRGSRQGNLGQPGPEHCPRAGLLRDRYGAAEEVPVTERIGLNFRAEAFNLFNHPIYANPSGNLFVRAALEGSHRF